ncbi:DUF4123 domain-containing protein [Marinobacter sp.]|uniref:DUF4123 domain-containing protein n=1 Tax=Marinobacter sp. TaxID=50741 RepID=UPI003A928E03
MKDSTALSHKAHSTTSFYHHKASLHADSCCYLVDQAKHPEVLRLLFEHDPAPVYDLPYVHSEYREQASDGPLVIKPTTSRSAEWLHNWLTEGKALALNGPQLALEEIRDHLVSLNTVRAPHGDSLFRYADPATLGSLGISLSNQQCLRVLGPLASLHGCYAGANWSLAKNEAEEASSESNKFCSRPLLLTKENLAAVERYRHQLLANALAANNELDEEVVSCWFQQLITLGAPDEQALVEGSLLLVTRGFSRELSDDELTTICNTRHGACWSDTLEMLATLVHSQEGT